MRAMAWMALSDVGSLSATSSSRTPVSAIRFDAVSTSAKLSSSNEKGGYARYSVCLWLHRKQMLASSVGFVSQNTIGASCLEERKNDREAEKFWKF